MKDNISATEGEERTVPPYLAGWGDEIVATETGGRSSGKEFMFLIVAILITVVAAGLASAFVEHPGEEVMLLSDATPGMAVDSTGARAASVDDYGIADTTGRIYQIPVDKAIEKLVAEKGNTDSEGIAIEQ